MLTESDTNRLNSITEKVSQIREVRGYPPARDEDKIAEILQKWDNAAYEEHRRLIESEQEFGSSIRPQSSANQSETLRKFPKMEEI